MFQFLHNVNFSNDTLLALIINQLEFLIDFNRQCLICLLMNSFFYNRVCTLSEMFLELILTDLCIVEHLVVRSSVNWIRWHIFTQNAILWRQVRSCSRTRSILLPFILAILAQFNDYTAISGRTKHLLWSMNSAKAFVVPLGLPPLYPRLVLLFWLNPDFCYYFYINIASNPAPATGLFSIYFTYDDYVALNFCFAIVLENCWSMIGYRTVVVLFYCRRVFVPLLETTSPLPDP